MSVIVSSQWPPGPINRLSSCPAFSGYGTAPIPGVGYPPMPCEARSASHQSPVHGGAPLHPSVVMPRPGWGAPPPRGNRIGSIAMPVPQSSPPCAHRAAPLQPQVPNVRRTLIPQNVRESNPAIAATEAAAGPCLLGSTALQQKAVRHSQNAAPKSGVLLCVGDSLTQGKKYSTDTYPAQLDAMLQQDGYTFAVKNEGISAETSDVMARRFPHALANASRFGPISFILLLTGTNDILQYRNPQQILQNLRRIHAAAAAAPGSPCIGALTLPRCRMFTPQQEEMRQIVNNGIKEICKQPGGRTKFLIDLDTVSVELATDGIHYYGAGYKEFAQLVLEEMRKLWTEETVANGW